MVAVLVLGIPEQADRPGARGGAACGIAVENPLLLRRIRPNRTALPRRETVAHRNHQGCRRMDQRRRLFRGGRPQDLQLVAHENARRVYALP